jgi:translocation and assembly module TamB
MGRFQGRIAGMPTAGALFDRLSAGNLMAQLRYTGPAESLWRLAAIDTFDITGALNAAADVTGTLSNPQVRGSLAGDDLRVQSALVGTDLQQVKARGTFTGSQLQLTSFAGQANNGTVLGSGTVDLAGMGPGVGPKIDLRIAASNAQLVNLSTMSATVTGPIRIVSNGVGGTIAGRVRLSKAHWRLGAASGAAALPSIKTTDINLPADLAPPTAPGAPWRFLIDASAPLGGIKVDGMGLDSEWSADIKLRGTTADPRIGGVARVVPRQGFYSFAGTRFDITRGVIDFNEDAPPDPQIDLVAETDVNSLHVTVTVGGSASKPDITFASTPAMPEEEILAQLLFGGSISNLSGTDALQLAAAVSSLRGGAGLDPINKLRRAIGLDELRIVPADPALGHGTALLFGKRFHKRFIVEIVTDGRGYNATSVEFRITRWLSLLATISTLGRESAGVEYRKDY